MKDNLEKTIWLSNKYKIITYFILYEILFFLITAIIFNIIRNNYLKDYQVLKVISYFILNPYILWWLLDKINNKNNKKTINNIYNKLSICTINTSYLSNIVKINISIYPSPKIYYIRISKKKFNKFFSKKIKDITPEDIIYFLLVYKEDIVENIEISNDIKQKVRLYKLNKILK